MTTRLATAAVILFSLLACSNEQMHSGESVAGYAARLASDHDAAFVVERLRALGSREGDDLAIDEDKLIGIAGDVGASTCRARMFATNEESS